jgi:N-acetylglucosaminyldiphosphoundecaprenol N-acetyl-beta-D-mannosaminyltransferase
MRKELQRMDHLKTNNKDESKVTIMKVPFSKLNLHDTVQKLTEQVEKQEERLFHLITANPEIVMVARQDALLQTIMAEAGMITPDGIGIVLASKWQREPLQERVTGYDILMGLLESGNTKGFSIYLLGADEQTSLKAAEVIGRQYPGVRIAGRHHGFFSSEQEPEIVSAIRTSRPDILVIAMGAPYSEKWIYKYKDVLQAKVAFGVGGSLDVMTGKVKRAPLLWQKIHLEWLYRLLSQPSRWRRQLLLPKFALSVLFGRGK